MTTIACPWAPCRWIGSPSVIRTDPADATATADMVPHHAVEGEADWFAPLCPGSLVRLPVSAEQREQLDHAQRSYLTALERRDQGRSVGGPVWNMPPGTRHGSREQVDDPAAAESCALCTAEGRAVLFAGRSGLIDHLSRAHSVDVRADVSPPPGGDIQSYFPVRPAESEHDEPAGPDTDTRQGGIFNMSNDHRSGLRGMLAIVSNESGLAGEACANITNHLDAALARIEQLASHHQSAAAMAVAAVGGESSDLPQSARDMIAASSNLGELVHDIRGAVQAAKERTESGARTARRVAKEAESYASTI